MKGLYPAIRRRLMWRGLGKSRAIMRTRLRRRGMRFRRFSFRKALSRRRPRVELKYTEGTALIAAGSNNRSANLAVSPTSLAQGTNITQRIGNEIKWMRYQIRGSLYTQPGTVAADRSAGVVRLILWEPRVQFTIADTYFGVLNYTEPVDFNTATVFKDEYISLGYENYDYTDGSTTQHTSPPVQSIKMISNYIPFPRKVKFSPNSNVVDSERATIYCTIINPNAFAVGFAYTYRITFLDA